MTLQKLTNYDEDRGSAYLEGDMVDIFYEFNHKGETYFANIAEPSVVYHQIRHLVVPQEMGALKSGELFVIPIIDERRVDELMGVYEKDLDKLEEDARLMDQDLRDKAFADKVVRKMDYGR